MSNSRPARALGFFLLLAGTGYTTRARAQQQSQGFAVERFYPSAPGGGWFVMDDLDLRGRLGGALELTLGYAGSPLRVGSGSQQLAVVSDQAFADIGAAITYDRWRFYLNFDAPLVISGESGTLDAYAFIGPSVDLGANPDILSDARVGADVRVWGEPGGRLRLGVGAQLLIPNGARADYETDGDFRGMIRALIAGDEKRFTYAGHMGIHIRPLDDSPVPESPRGNELLFGAAAGARLPVGSSGQWEAVIGPEVFGATAFKTLFDGSGTALESLFTARIEGTRTDALQIRIKLGIGGGLNRHFGAPEWRMIVGVEMFNHARR